MTTPTGFCGWNTGRAQSGPARCGKPRKGRTNHPATDNGEACGTHLRAARSDRNRPVTVTYAVMPDLRDDGCGKCGGITMAEHYANIDAGFMYGHAFVGAPSEGA